MLLFFSISSQFNRSRALVAFQIPAFKLVSQARAMFGPHAKFISSFVSHSCALYCNLYFANSFSFNSFRTLCEKYRGVGGMRSPGYRPGGWLTE